MPGTILIAAQLVTSREEITETRIIESSKKSQPTSHIGPDWTAQHDPYMKRHGASNRSYHDRTCFDPTKATKPGQRSFPV